MFYYPLAAFLVTPSGECVRQPSHDQGVIAPEVRSGMAGVACSHQQIMMIDSEGPFVPVGAGYVLKPESWRGRQHVGVGLN